jgi:Fic-DOC domain mobile mystery protein B
VTAADGRRHLAVGPGSEPNGATPLEAEDLRGLIPEFVATREDLDVVEFENIARALPWAYREARRCGPLEILSYGFLFELHRQMFADVWKWAGTQRIRETNIGVAPARIPDETALVLGDALYWHANATYPTDERAARLHFRLVSVHPFPNGNGRCTRLLADLYLEACGEDSFTWGGSNLAAAGVGRDTYIAAIHDAAEGDFRPLLEFARS